VLLLSLAATSIIGTLIPQNEDPAAYFQAFGGFLYRLFDILGLFDMYHSWWFQLLIILLTVNIVVCSIDRMSANRKILFVRKPSFKLAKFRNLTLSETFTDDRSLEELNKAFQAAVKKYFGNSLVEATEQGFAVFGEKGRWTRFGVYTVHLSVVLLLVGGLIGSIFGFDGFVNIPEGESANRIQSRNTPHMIQLGFTIRCDDYDESYYETGAPKEFRSSLTILEQGREVLKKDIYVNDPLRYRGISIYQSSRGKIPPNELVLSFTSSKTGMIYTRNAGIDQPVKIPEKLGTFVLKEFRQSGKFKGHDIGQTFAGVLTPPDGAPIEVLLPLRFPSFDKMRKGDVVIAVVDYVDRFYTGLQVTKDPGVWIVYSGFILMIIGCYITFFRAHQQLCVEVIQKDEKCRVVVSGTANKNKLGYEQKVKKIVQSLADDDRLT
jgi:cytochrome c biogenesis protein